MEKFRVRDRFILGKLNELIGAKQLRAEGSRHRASADVKQNEAVRLSPFIQMRNGYWDSAIPGKWSANQKLAGNGLLGSGLGSPRPACPQYPLASETASRCHDCGCIVADPEVIWPRHDEISTGKS